MVDRCSGPDLKYGALEIVGCYALRKSENVLDIFLCRQVSFIPWAISSFLTRWLSALQATSVDRLKITYEYR